MQYMVIERYKDKEAVYKRFHEKGRMMPEGVSYVNSWVTEDGNKQPGNECENGRKQQEVIRKWIRYI